MMKKILTVLLLGGGSIAAQAGVLTVNNNPNGPGQYQSLQQAIDSASTGDSIYVHGSATSYGNVSVKKMLHFFGTGHNPNKTNKLVSEVGTFTLDSVIGVSGASGSTVTGFKLGDIKGYTGNGGTNNVLISRNYFKNGSTVINVKGSGWVIQNNIIGKNLINLNNNSTITIRNNIFDQCFIQSSNQPTVIIANNIFFGNGATTAFSTVSNALISNNIFSGSSPKGTAVNTNAFSNNITYQTSYDTIPFGTNLGSGNFVAQDPQFTNVSTNSFNYAYDFTLASGSPGKNAGTDGSDIGIYGGQMPFIDMTGAPAIPQLKSVLILNPVITVGDSLQVIINGNKQQ